MLPSSHTARSLAVFRSGVQAVFLLLPFLVIVVPASAADTSSKTFNVPAGEASATLRQFAQQAGQQVVFAVRDVRGVQTVEVKGHLPVRVALDRMLANTDLIGTFDEKSSTFAVRKRTEAESKNVHRAIAQTSARPSRRNRDEPKDRASRPLALGTL